MQRCKRCSSPVSTVRAALVIGFGSLLIYYLDFPSYERPLDEHTETFVKGSDVADICRVAQAVSRLEISLQSYPGLEPVHLSSNDGEIEDSVPHLSTLLCEQQQQQQRQQSTRFLNPMEMISSNTTASAQHSLKRVFAFKAARTGSTFFTTTLTETIQYDLQRPAVYFWEPYANQKCRATPEAQESELHQILNNAQCVPYPMTEKCFPGRYCSKENDNESPKGTRKEDPTVRIAATNPRFLHTQLNWRGILHTDGSSRVVSLRRTNQVLMAYSKFHHGGCATRESPKSHSEVFDLEMLLQCVQHYTLWEQEFSSSVAVRASSMIAENQKADHMDRRLPFVVVYEDVLARGDLVQRGLMAYLVGSKSSTTKAVNKDNMFEEHATTHKLHTAPFCDYDDVDCSSLRQGLLQYNYPCLLKQLTWEHDKNQVWSVPMLSDGTISIHGDCVPLPPLNDHRSVRGLQDLYRIPPLL